METRYSLLLVGCLLSVSLASAALSPPEGPNHPTISPATTGVSNPATATLNRTSAANGMLTTTAGATPAITGGGAPPNGSAGTSTAPTASSVSTHTPGPAAEAGETNTTSTPPTGSPPTTVPTTQSPATTVIFNTTSNLTTTQSPATTVIFNTTSNLTTTQSPATTVIFNTTSNLTTTQSPATTSHPPSEDPPTANTTSWVSTTNTALNDTRGTGVRLDDYEKTLTVVFSVVLGVSILGLVMYQMTRCHQRRVQYSHQPLTENTGDLFISDEDTLVISGGLYEGHVSEPITTQQDFPPGPSQLTQFRLEFLNDG
ncbi:sialomucin core protein 24-like isoform X2 [Osmerus eperlanus]|uniref:sialomucin core protein 24-like isoform X2 n=1 Tax=Osmerus eperlanus TaxID=29151 RepID=UPI002E0EFE77